jgi:predicted phosphodiesterase
MKIALIADVHGNIFALDAVLDDAKKNGADTYVFVGDNKQDYRLPRSPRY